METSRSGAGGKIVTNRRKQRLAATPYDRPPPQPSQPPPPKSPNWFTGIVVPSAKALASGAGKIFSAIFSESETSSCEDEDSASEDDIDNDNHYEIPDNGVNTLDETNLTPSEMIRYGQESHSNEWRGETKRIIEQLIMQETFSREECDRLTRVLNSRVEKTVDPEVADIYDKAVEEAKKWFQDKKVGSSSVAELARGTSNLESTGLEQVESEGGSPVDLARFYMKDRPPWASSGRNVELSTPLTKTRDLFKEGTSHSVGDVSFSSSKKRSHLASGSWNIQEELRRVRSKATEEMLRTPSTKIDPSLFAFDPIRVDSVGSCKVNFVMGERMTEPEPSGKTEPLYALVDAGVSSDPALAALQSRQDGEARETRPSRPATSVSGNNEASEAVQKDDECAASKFPQPSSHNNAEEHHTDTSKIHGPQATDSTELGGKRSVNGLPSSSLSAGVAMEQNLNYDLHNEKNHGADNASEKKPVNIINVEGNCELLTEAYMEIPILTETNSLASGSQNSLGLQYEELSLDMAAKEKVDILAGKQQGRKSGRYNRRGRGKR